MIDTILISNYLEILPNRKWTIQKTTDIRGTKNVCFLNDALMRLTYYPDDKKLFIETSLPHLLFNKNHRLILNDCQLQDALAKMKTILDHKIKIETSDPMSYLIHKIDACWNFEVSDVDKYLSFFSALPLPYHGYPICFQNKTVTWKSTTEGLKFYDKYTESKFDPECKNMLRMELRMMHQSHFRKELQKNDDYKVKFSDITLQFLRNKLKFYLTRFFGSEIIEENKEKREMSETEKIMKQGRNKRKYLKSIKPQKALQVLGFVQALNNKEMLQLPKRTYYRYIKELREINFGSDLKPLNMDQEYSKVLLQ